MTEFLIGTLDYLDECTEAMRGSQLAVYFTTDESAAKSIMEGLSKKEIIVALDPEGKFAGFLWYLPKGAFHGCPYLHIVTVKKEYRGQGYGKRLIDHLEEILEHKGRLFLVVGDFNSAAQRLYENLGFCQVGAIPDLYKEGVTEHLMMKVLG